jgi:hypothetical protein
MRDFGVESPSKSPKLAFRILGLFGIIFGLFALDSTHCVEIVNKGFSHSQDCNVLAQHYWLSNTKKVRVFNCNFR